MPTLNFDAVALAPASCRGQNRRAILDAGLKDAGFTDIMLMGETKGLLERIYAVDPDVIIIDLQNQALGRSGPTGKERCFVALDMSARHRRALRSRRCAPRVAWGSSP